MGAAPLECLATPGHTPESICVARYDRDAMAPSAVLTGDTLFIGNVGRPDLLGGFGISAEELGRALYTSLHDKLLTLPDAVRVLPAHGAGSACGEQPQTNYALCDMGVDEFVARFTEGQPAVPGYFPFAAVTNRKARAVFHEGEQVAALSLDEALDRARDGAMLIDGRQPSSFAAGQERGAVNVALDGRFAEQVGRVVPAGVAMVLVGDPTTAAEARTRLARIGFDGVVGQLSDPIASMVDRPDAVARFSRLTVEQLVASRSAATAPVIIDVRNPGEVEAAGFIPGALATPLAQRDGSRDALDPAMPTVVVCASGNRSSNAASLLAAKGFADVSDLLGGMDAFAGGRAAG